ncbi:hypothetical protein EVAR_40549_1 [Eumeta japonica]|uniref:Uncharacterized protein n=1 Tax=Eumeta variegata TaxID=151549 RepID=A0A4C1VXX9_EUMVA|nr:hypothetical protein EVAR_40549_1 [Eumeta japonica]
MGCLSRIELIITNRACAQTNARQPRAHASTHARAPASQTACRRAAAAGAESAGRRSDRAERPRMRQRRLTPDVRGRLRHSHGAAASGDVGGALTDIGRMGEREKEAGNMGTEAGRCDASY